MDEFFESSKTTLEKIVGAFFSPKGMTVHW